MDFGEQDDFNTEEQIANSNWQIAKLAIGQNVFAVRHRNPGACRTSSCRKLGRREFM
jgi:hypothetical protein